MQVESRRLSKTNASRVARWCDGDLRVDRNVFEPDAEQLSITIYEHGNEMVAYPGDWVVLHNGTFGVLTDHEYQIWCDIELEGDEDDA